MVEYNATLGRLRGGRRGRPASASWRPCTCGVGILTDDLVVLELDGAEGKASLGKLEARLGALPSTWTVATPTAAGTFTSTTRAGWRSSHCRPTLRSRR